MRRTLEEKIDEDEEKRKYDIKPLLIWPTIGVTLGMTLVSIAHNVYNFLRSETELELETAKILAQADGKMLLILYGASGATLLVDYCLNKIRNCMKNQKNNEMTKYEKFTGIVEKVERAKNKYLGETKLPRYNISLRSENQIRHVECLLEPNKEINLKEGSEVDIYLLKKTLNYPHAELISTSRSELEKRTDWTYFARKIVNINEGKTTENLFAGNCLNDILRYLGMMSLIGSCSTYWDDEPFDKQVQK